MVCGTGNLRSLTDGRFAPRSASLASPLQPPQTAFTAICNYTYFLHKKVLHFPPADDIILLAVKVDGKNKNSIWGISTVGRTNHQLFIPDVEFLGKAVNVKSVQNLAKIFGALAQLVEQAFRCLSPVPILHRKAVNVKSAQNLAGIFGAIAQLVEQAFSCLSPMLNSSERGKQLPSNLHKIWQRYLGH